MTTDHVYPHLPVVILLLFDFIQASDVDEVWAQVFVGVLTVIDKDVFSCQIFSTLTQYLLPSLLKEEL